jgi:YggT family protein
LRSEETHTTYVEEPVHDDVHTQSTVRYEPSGVGMVERLIIWIFGVVQLLIILRIVLLLFAAREGNPLVNLIYTLTDLLVAPFRGIFGINEIAAGQTALDVAALVALVGWTILELVILGLVRIFRPARYA